jgi:hypothetical protein
MANATYEQGDLQIKLFDLRREAKLRQAREWFQKNYIANTFQEAMKVAPMGTEAGAFYMMVVSYWEQVGAYLNHGLLNEDLFFETTGEFFFVWERIKPSIPEGRKVFQNPLFAASLEKMAQKYEAWMNRKAPGSIDAMRQMMKQMSQQQAGKANA